MIKKNRKAIHFLLVFYCINSLNAQNSNVPGNNFEENKNKFVSEGFGFTYELDEMMNMDLFVLNYGEPKQRIEQIIVNRHDGINDKIMTLDYDRFIVTFYVWNKERTGSFPDARLQSIESKNGVEYIFGIKNGMTIYELMNIIGGIELSGDVIYLHDSNYLNVATIKLENNIIGYIVWNYSLE